MHALLLYINGGKFGIPKIVKENDKMTKGEEFCWKNLLEGHLFKDTN